MDRVKRTRPKTQIPKEIIEQILSKLPVKSLLRLRCASKSWNRLIGSERFIRIHLENSRKETSLAHRRVIFKYVANQELDIFTSSKMELLQYPLHSVMNDSNNEPITNPTPFDHGRQFGIVGCCNGLVCIMTENQSFYLWNPSTRTSVELPKVNSSEFIPKFGFGWDEESGAYKVFAFLSDWTGQVYSSKANKWRKINEFDYHEPSYESPRFEEGVLVSGKLHWLRVRMQHGYGYIIEIVSVDLKSEEVGIMEYPCECHGNRVPGGLSLGVVRGCLSVSHIHQNRVNIGVMEEYGVKDSWLELMSFLVNSVCFDSVLCLGDGIPRPTGMSANANGEILIICGCFFVVYDYYAGLWVKKIKCLYNRRHIRNQARVCIQSLISPQTILDQ